MCRINRRHLLDFAFSQLGHHFSETVASVAHREQMEPIPRPGSLPPPRNRVRRRFSAERAFELIRNDEDLQRHGRNFQFSFEFFRIYGNVIA